MARQQFRNGLGTCLGLALFLVSLMAVQPAPVSAQGLPDLTTLRGSVLRPTSDWESTIANIERKYAHRTPDQDAIVFIGSSSIVRWTTLEQDFPGLPVLNAGFGGSQIIDSVYYADRLVIPYAPHTVVFFAGSNDISAGKQPTQVLADYVAFVERVHQTLPQTQILFISISPSPSRWSQHPKVVEANRLIKLYTDTDERLGYIDIYPAMLGPDGTPPVELYVSDLLHMSPLGYAIWIEAVTPYLSFPYQRVWLSAPAAAATPVMGPAALDVRVAADLAVSNVRVKVGDLTVYDAPSAHAGPITTPYLADGPHNVVLEVTDKDGGLWRRTARIQVQNAKIVEPGRGAVLQDKVLARFASGYDLHMMEKATITLTPIRLGEVQHDEERVLYQGNVAPDTISLDSPRFADGTYELAFAVQTLDGHVSRDAYPVIVRNWEVVSDPFLPPQSNPWFGSLDRKKTSFESAGWEYATGDANVYLGDADRRVWLGEGEGHLIWEVPALDHVQVTLYSQSADLSRLSISVSDDQERWQAVPWIMTDEANARGSWVQVKLRGDVQGVDSVRYVRLTLGEGLGADRVQLGHVELVYPARRQR